MENISKKEEIPMLEQNPSSRKIHVEYGLDKWLDLKVNREWTLKTVPEQEKIWKINLESSILIKAVDKSLRLGQMNINHYWNTTLSNLYRHSLGEIEKINDFCRQNNIPFAYDNEYIERITVLCDKLNPDRFYYFSDYDKEREPEVPKDVTVYDVDPVLIPFLPYIKELEKELKKESNVSSSILIDESSPLWPVKIIPFTEESQKIVQKIEVIRDSAVIAGSSYAIGNEAKEAIDLYREDIEQKKRLYELLKEKGIKIPVHLTYLLTGAILECALFEKKYNDRVFDPFLFSEELNYDYKRIVSKGFKEGKEIERTVDQQILGQEFIDLQNEITQQ